MINVYAKYFIENVEYCSDSDGYWRHKDWKIFYVQIMINQVLTHPGWWQKNKAPAFSRVKRCINGRSQSVKNEYINTFKKLGRKIIY